MDMITKMLIVNGKIPLEDVTDCELIDRINLIKNGIEACKHNIVFPFGTEEIRCYQHKNVDEEIWGELYFSGIFMCLSSTNGHILGCCNLKSFSDVFWAFDNPEFGVELRRFLLEQIELKNAIK